MGSWSRLCPGGFLSLVASESQAVKASPCSLRQYASNSLTVRTSASAAAAVPGHARGLPSLVRPAFSSGTSAFPSAFHCASILRHILQNFLFPVLSIALSLHPAFFQTQVCSCIHQPERHGHIVAFFPVTKTKPGWRWADFRSTFFCEFRCQFCFMKSCLKRLQS